MLNIKLAFAQTNPVVGDFQHNSTQICQLIEQAASSGVELLMFGELALSGYPLADFSYRPDVIAASENALERVVEFSKAFPSLTILLGHVTAASASANELQVSYAIAHNSASLIRDGLVLGSYHKQSLPNYDVFDDWRNFIPGSDELKFELNGHRLAVAICEDIWANPARGRALESAGVEMVCVLNGSPFTKGKQLDRRAAARQFASGMFLAYANLSGGQDELVFDGDSFLIDPDGEELFRAPMSEGLYIADSQPIEITPDIERLWTVLVTGLRDYLGKTGQRRVVLGLSGGIDSALCAAIAVSAVGPENVLGVALPSRYSSTHSLSDAEQLAKNLGIEYRVVPIDGAQRAFEQTVSLSDLAAENLQARIRAVILMGISNSEGHLLISTGNKSEIAVGYSTIYGDAAGGFAPIKDVFKTEVWQLARYFNQRSGSEQIPESSITKPPSAELRPGQLDQDSLPDYAILDQILEMLIEEGITPDQIAKRGFDTSLISEIEAMVRRAEWKRSQAAIGTKVSRVAFGRGRRVPLTTRFGKQ